MKALKIFGITVGIVLVLGVVAALVVASQANSLLATAIEEVGTEATGAPVTVESVDFSLFAASCEIRGLTVANPEGFQEPSSFSLGRLFVQLDAQTLDQEVIVIKELTIDTSQITCEGIAPNNLKTILKNLENYAGSDEAEEDEASQTKVIIEKFTFTNGKARVVTAAANSESEIKTVELQDVGRKSGGITIVEAIPQLLRPIVSTVFQQAAGGMGLKVEEGGVLNKVKGIFNR